MKYRTMSGCVTVTGPPASICALNFGTTEPFDASTLPKRTEISRIGAPPAVAATREVGVERLAIHLGEALGGAQHRHRLDRLVGRDHHHRRRAGGDRGVGDVDRAEDVGLDALAPVLLEQRHVLERGGVEHDVGLEVGEQPEDAVAIAHVGKPALDARGAPAWSRASPAPRRAPAPNSRPPAAAPRRTSRRGRRFRRRSSRRRRSRPPTCPSRNSPAADSRSWRSAAAAGPRPRPAQAACGRALLERRQAAGREPEPPRLHQDCLGLLLGHQRGRRQHDARHPCALGSERRNRVLKIARARPNTGTPRIAWPWSAGDGDRMPTGQIFLTAPLSIARSSISASAATPENQRRDRIRSDHPMAGA